MKKTLIASLLLFIALPCFAADFILKSASWKNGEAMDNKYVFNDFGCSGKNVSPQAEWSNPPEGTQSYAVTVYDPDAPTGSGWWHWTGVNIPAGGNSLGKKGGPNNSNMWPLGINIS